MPVPAQRDEAALRAGLARWLASKLDAADVELSALSGPAFSGFSNETLLFDVSYSACEERRTKALAVRLEPSGHQVFPDAVFETQVRLIHAVREAGIPAPEILWFEQDPAHVGARFFVMTRVDGRVPSDNPPYHAAGWLHDVSPAVRERIWWNGLAAMADVHRLDWQAMRLTFVPILSATDRLKRDREYLAWVVGDRRYPLVETTFDHLEATMPPDSEPALCWGDSRIGNVIFGDAGEVRAVLDWEMVSIGNPLNDLAWFVLLDRHHSEICGAPRLEGFPSYDDTIARWSDLTGRSTAVLGWWQLLGAARYAAIMTRVFDLLENTGILPGAGMMAFENTGTALLKAVLADGTA
jgi:aminoglycoside phosphotransferase (APT) family kinase protein